jgi:hypothetical protein
MNEYKRFVIAVGIWIVASGSIIIEAQPLVVDWGHDWGAGWYRQQPHQEQNGAWRALAQEDLNGNGTTDDDFIGGWPYSWDEPLSPQNLVYDYTYPSARFFGAAVTKTTDIPEKEDGTGYVRITGPTEGHINQNHELRDDWNLMTFPTRKREPELSRYAGALLVFWKKEDFLNGGDRYRVSFEKDGYIAVFISRYWGGVDWGRWVIRQHGQFYISQATFADEIHAFDLTEASPHDGARNPVVRRAHAIHPHQTTWALYEPHAPHHVFFDVDQAAFHPMTFEDVEAIGFLAQRDLSVGRPVAGGLWNLPHGIGEPIALKFNAVQARASVEKKETTSTMVELRAVGESGYTTPHPVSYAEWVRLWRWAVTNQRARQFTSGFEQYEIPGYVFLRDGAMGSMETGRNETHAPSEPVTMISWYDAILWCNALSEYEGRGPAYYADEACTVPLREVYDRAKKENRDIRPIVFWKPDADGYRLPTKNEIAYGQQQGIIKKNEPVALWVWDDETTVSDPSLRKSRTVVGGTARQPEQPTAMPWGEYPLEGTYDVGFRVWRNGKGIAEASSVVATRELVRDQRIMPSESMGEGRLRAWTMRKLRLVLVEGAGGLPVNEIIERSYSETGAYDLMFAATETPYSVWNYVRQWAMMERGYLFNHAGDMGSLHYLIAGREPMERHRDEPVTNITWWDAVVWCNALSELLGRDPVYLDKETGEPIRDANTLRVAMYQEYAYPNTGRYPMRPLDTGAIMPLRTDTGRNGFRLPALAEFYAAHKKNASEEQGWFASNAAGRTHPVGHKEPGPHGLYDMDGNVQEMTYGGDALFGQIRAGNHFADPPGHYPHGITRKEHPAVGRAYLGFRVVARP